MMNKGVFLKSFAALAFLILCLNGVFAISSNIKEVYEPKETMIIKLSGSILSPITSANVRFMRANVNLPLDYDAKKIGNDYYIWAIAPENENNYTLYVDDISSMVAGTEKIINYSANFRVSGNLTDYYIKPGFITSNKNFEIKAILNSDESRSVEINFPYERQAILVPGENKLTFDISDISGNQAIQITIGKYIIPAYLIGNNSAAPTEEEIHGPVLIFSPERIRSVVLIGSSYPRYNIGISNSGDREAKGIYFDFDRTLFSINPDIRVDLKANETFYYNLSLRSKVNESLADKAIYARYGNLSYPLYVDVDFTLNASETGTKYSGISGAFNYSNYRCIEIGASCTSEETCNGTAVQVADGACCIGLCKTATSGSAGISWVGWIAGLIIVAMLVYVGYRYYSRKGSSGLGSIFKKKVAEAEEKI